jgi:hypothetical protein
VVNYLPPVLLTPAVHLDLRIFPRIFDKKIEMVLLRLSGAWGKMIHEKHLKQKISSKKSRDTVHLGVNSEGNSIGHTAPTGNFLLHIMQRLAGG